MVEYLGELVYKLRFVGAGLLVGMVICLIAVVLSIASSASASSSGDYVSPGGMLSGSYDSPNVVSGGLAMMVDDAGQNLQSFGHGIGSAFSGIPRLFSGFPKSFSSGAAATGRLLAGSARATGHIAYVGGMATVRGSVAVITFFARIPLNMVGFITHVPGVSTVTHPADQEPVPVIDPNSPDLKTALAALPPTPATPVQAAAQPAAVQPTNAVVVQWPIHGAITTEFGVPEPPYEPIHTGIDISDGQRSGVTPVKPFRAGTVIATLTTGGLGNHVVVDHGNGVTSVYGHMARIAVTVGQAVDTNTTLGYEGSTGVSTGPHVHFEIRVNGQATNPHQFIPGHP